MLHVVVHADHIGEGIADNAERCPVALAIRDAIEDKYGTYAPHIEVLDNAICIGRYQTTRTYAMPESVRAFVYWFDRLGKWNDRVKEFEFDLDYEQ